MPTLKKCPRCGTVAALDATMCVSCGHGYRTQFAPAAPEPTQAFHAAPPPLPRSAADSQRIRRQDRVLFTVLGVAFGLIVLIAISPCLLGFLWAVIGGVQERLSTPH